MSTMPAKFEETLDEAVSRLISRADDARGLTDAELRPRIEKVADKYLFRDTPDADRNTLRTFVEVRGRAARFLAIGATHCDCRGRLRVLHDGLAERPQRGDGQGDHQCRQGRLA